MTELPIITHVEFLKLDYENRPLIAVSARPVCSLSIRKSGKTVVTVDGVTLTSTPDTLTYIPSGCPYTTEIPEGLTLDHAFECVGGNGSPIAIEQIIGVIKPEGTISILGVSEYPVPINTRMILEKGLRLFGTSRSGKEDFRRTVELYREHPEIPLYLSRLVGSTVEIDSFADIKKAFEIDIRKAYGKTILHWNI